MSKQVMEVSEEARRKLDAQINRAGLNETD